MQVLGFGFWGERKLRWVGVGDGVAESLREEVWMVRQCYHCSGVVHYRRRLVRKLGARDLRHPDHGRNVVGDL